MGGFCILIMCFACPLHHLFMTAAPPSVPAENVRIIKKTSYAAVKSSILKWSCFPWSTNSFKPAIQTQGETLAIIGTAFICWWHSSTAPVYWDFFFFASRCQLTRLTCNYHKVPQCMVGIDIGWICFCQVASSFIFYWFWKEKKTYIQTSIVLILPLKFKSTIYKEIMLKMHK